MQLSTLELRRDILQEADFLATQMAQTSLESFYSPSQDHKLMRQFNALTDPRLLNLSLELKIAFADFSMI